MTTETDPQVARIQHLLEQNYLAAHPNAAILVRRQNSAVVRVRVIDAAFHGMSRIEREEGIWKYLEELSSDDFESITMLLLLTPEEAGNSLLNVEFEDPQRSAIA